MGHRSYVPWAAAAGVLPATAALTARMRAVDLAYHVRAGEMALRAQDIVRTDPFTFTRGGEPWLNQQWASQLLLAAAYRLGAWVGVAIFYAAAIGAGFTLLYRVVRRAGTAPPTAAVLTILGFVLGAGSLGARPQAFAVPLFTGTWLLLQRRDRTTWLVPLVAIVWANVHGSFVLAPVLTGFAVVEDVSERLPVGRPAAVAAATVLATFVTPFGPTVWAYALDVASDETIRTTVREWRPPSPLSGPGLLFWISGAVVAVIAAVRRERVRPVDVLRLLVFFALGAAAVRSTLWWALTAPAVVARWVPLEAPAPQRERGSTHAAVATAIAAVIVLAAALWSRAGVDPITGAPRRVGADAPQVLVDATRRALPAGSRLLVFQPFASWFEHALPGDPVMVDSRIELFPIEVWRDYDRAIVAADGWQAIADRHAIDGVVLPPGAVLAPELSSAGWRRVVDGEAGSVFVRS